MMDMVFPTTAGMLSQALGAELIGEESRAITKLSPLTNPSHSALTYLSDKQYENLLSAWDDTTLITTKELAPQQKNISVIIVEDPKRAFAKIAETFAPKNPWKGISPKAAVHETAKIGKNVAIAPFAVIAEGAVIGDNTTLFPNVYVGPGVIVGENCEIHSHASLVVNVEVGNNVKIFSGSVLGSEGFGYLEGDSGYSAIPQIGKVVIEDHVRIGAKCTIDRSTYGETRVGHGTKIDDQVHIGHNCRIGKNAIICAQVGLAGSTVLEDGVILAGQVGIAGHVTIGSGAIIGGQAGVGTNLKGGQRYLGSPAVPLRERLLAFKYTLKLPELFDRVRKIEKQLKETP